MVSEIKQQRQQRKKKKQRSADLFPFSLHGIKCEKHVVHRPHLFFLVSFLQGRDLYVGVIKNRKMKKPHSSKKKKKNRKAGEYKVSRSPALKVLRWSEKKKRMKKEKKTWCVWNEINRKKGVLSHGYWWEDVVQFWVKKKETCLFLHRMQRGGCTTKTVTKETKNAR